VRARFLLDFGNDKHNSLADVLSIKKGKKLWK
jgi:hypothetical protein